ncbi:hypothetical protein [Chitinophaga jiangningensis]|nr:hypothetical protein [Chitinophaga jiangningensis]
MNKPANWLILLAMLGSRQVLAQADTIFVTGNAATLITCKHPVKAVQIESEHPWFVTQIVGKVIMIRAAGIPPILLNALVVTTKQVYPIVIMYNAATSTGTLQYRIPGRRKPPNHACTESSWQELLAVADKITNGFNRSDTAGVARIAANFLNESGKLHCKVKQHKISAGFVRGMKLNGLFYLHLQMAGKSVIPAEIEAVRVLQLDVSTKTKDGVPLMLRTGNPLVIKGRKTALGLVIPALPLGEVIILVAIKLRNITPPLIVKIRRKNLPPYMLQPDFS